jgi:hypothetical protein
MVTIIFHGIIITIIFIIIVSLPVLVCNLSLTLCCDCPYRNYLYLHCAVSVIGLVAVDSAQNNKVLLLLLSIICIHSACLS